MAIETINVTAGSGTPISVDNCGSEGYSQVVKLAISTDGSATLIPAEATNGLDVDVTRVIPGTTATALGKAVDTAMGATDTGVLAVGVRRDTVAASSGTTGDIEPLSTDSVGRLRSRSVLTDSSDNVLTFTAPLTIAFTPTIGTAACVNLDSLHTTVITFANAAATTDGGGLVTDAGLWVKDDIGDDIRLWLFSRSVTGTTAQDPLSVSDADLVYCVGWVDFTNWGDAAVGRFAKPNRSYLPLQYHCSNGGTSLFGILQLIDATTPTYTAAGIGGFIECMPF